MKKYCLIFSFLFFLSPSVFADEPKNLHAFISAGVNYHMPNSILVGWNKWEFGQVSQGIYGAVKREFFKKHYYVGFGPIIAGAPGGMAVGFEASMGFDYSLFWILGFRGEIQAIAAHTGFMGAAGNVGVSFDF